MVAVAAAFAVAVVLVDDDRLAIGNELVGARTATIQNTLPGFLVTQQVENIRALGGRVFRVRVVYVETRTVVQDLVQGHVVLLVWNLAGLVMFEAARVHHRLFLIVIP